MDKRKSFLFYKINTFLLIIITLVLLSLTLTGILFLERKVQKTFLYTSAMKVATEIKYLQIQAIIKERNYLISVEDNNTRFKVIDLSTNEVILRESPLFENIKIYVDEDTILLSGINFNKYHKITLSRRNIHTFIYLFQDGRVVVKEE